MNHAALLSRALFIKRTLGLCSASGFLRNRDVPVQVAASVLARTPGYRRPQPAQRPVTTLRSVWAPVCASTKVLGLVAFATALLFCLMGERQNAAIALVSCLVLVLPIELFEHLSGSRWSLLQS